MLAAKVTPFFFLILCINACSSVQKETWKNIIPKVQDRGFLDENLFASPCLLSLNERQDFSSPQVQNQLEVLCEKNLWQAMENYIISFQDFNKRKRLPWTSSLPPLRQKAWKGKLKSMFHPKLIYQKRDFFPQKKIHAVMVVYKKNLASYLQSLAYKG
ncbi:MAG: hypothetical protein D6767_09465 [Candidatus Hydrogenedentota bacterium]|nr:MAG: hypothetical protein D6767_09465 [Candidatus Hydrogenedentota bacterium]